MAEHSVTEDLVGPGPCEHRLYQRIVCRGSHGEAALVRQPWMKDDAKWEVLKANFRKIHPDPQPK